LFLKGDCLLSNHGGITIFHDYLGGSFDPNPKAPMSGIFFLHENHEHQP